MWYATSLTQERSYAWSYSRAIKYSSRLDCNDSVIIINCNKFSFFGIIFGIVFSHIFSIQLPKTNYTKLMISKLDENSINLMYSRIKLYAVTRDKIWLICPYFGWSHNTSLNIFGGSVAWLAWQPVTTSLSFLIAQFRQEKKISY